MSRRTGYGGRSRRSRRTTTRRRTTRRTTTRAYGRRRPASRLPWPWVGGAVALCAVLAALAVFGGGTDGPGAAPPPDLLVLATGSSNERRPALPEEARTELRMLGLTGEAPSAMVVGVDGDGTTSSEVFDLTPRRRSGDEEHTPKRREAAVEGRVEEIDRALSGIVSAAPGHALLAGLQEVGRIPVQTVVVVSSGIDTNDPFDLRRTGFDYPSADLISYLRKADALPELSGRDVILALSPAAGRQPALDEPSRRNVERLWTDLLRASGATVRSTATGSQDEPAGTVDTPAVPIPEITSPTPKPTPGGRVTTFILPGNLLFEPNKATLLDPREAATRLRTVVAEVDGRTTVKVVGHTALAPGGTDDGRALSTRRAHVIRNLLVGLGVPARAVTGAVGVGHSQPIVKPATDPRNRAVVVILTRRT
jgi:outer membrane protein OmpA-like peptidoglycan-associated protein